MAPEGTISTSQVLLIVVFSIHVFVMVMFKFLPGTSVVDCWVGRVVSAVSPKLPESADVVDSKILVVCSPAVEVAPDIATDWEVKSVLPSVTFPVERAVDSSVLCSVLTGVMADGVVDNTVVLALVCSGCVVVGDSVASSLVVDATVPSVAEGVVDNTWVSVLVCSS